MPQDELKNPGPADKASPGFCINSPLMRLDLFLKSSRLCARRTLAQKLCEAGLISVNNKTAKSSTAVKLGDNLTIRRGDRITAVRVVSLPAARQTSRSEAGKLYEILSEETVIEDR